MKLDTYLQFDFLPMNVRKCEDKQSYKDEMASHMEAYFNDQRLKQAMKTQSNEKAYLIIYQAYRLKIQKNLQGQKERSFALSIIRTTEDNLDKTQRLKQMKLYIKENKRDLQERMLCLGQKKENQSNQKGETLFLGQKKAN